MGNQDLKTLQAELAKSQAENAALREAASRPQITVYLSEKTGSVCLSVPGKGTTGFHADKWDVIAEHAPAVLEFLTTEVRAQAATLRAKAQAAKKAG